MCTELLYKVLSCVKKTIYLYVVALMDIDHDASFTMISIVLFPLTCDRSNTQTVSENLQTVDT